MSFIAGYLLGLGEGSTAPVIQPLYVTQNGEYSSPDGTDGYDPVYVNVPDRYDEGYNDGYKDGYDDGYNEGYDEGYNDGYDDGKSSGEYIFPEGTEYEDIYGLVGGDKITDKNTGYGICSMTVISESDPTRQDVFAAVVDSEGNLLARLYGWNAPVSSGWRIEKIHVTPDGRCDITASHLNNSGVRVQSQVNDVYSVYLKGFGESGHTFGISNS